MTRGYVTVQEPHLGLKAFVVPGWVWDNEPEIFIVNPTTVRAGIFDTIKDRKALLHEKGYSTWLEYTAFLERQTILARERLGPIPTQLIPSPPLTEQVVYLPVESNQPSPSGED